MYRVMIVEDDPMVSSIDRQYVEMDSAFQVVQMCRDGREGLEFLSRESVDLIILDYYTPTMTGMEFMDALRAAGHSCAVIMVTSANDTCIVQELLSRGIMDYLVKPFQYGRFQQALGHFHQSRRMLEWKSGGLEQSEIDQMMRGQPPGPAAKPLAKGLNQGTLDHVRAFFAAHPGASFTSEQVAEGVGLSRITVRRYVSHMAEGGEIASEIDYQTGGRPAIRYFCTKSAE